MDRHGNAYSQDYLNQSDLSNRMASMGIGNGAPTSNLNQSNAPPSFHSHGLEVRGPGYAGNGGMPGNPLPVSAYEYMNEKSYPTPPQRFPQHQMNPMNPRGAPRSFVNGQSNIHQIRGNSGTSSPPQFVGSFDGGAGGSPGNVPPSKSTTLFVGDLSVLCDEEKLFDLFHTFGKIESIQLKKSDIDHQRAHLSYGFIKFFTHEAAATALDQLNGMPYLGRNLRVGWADDHPANHYAHTKPVINTVPPKKNNPTAQIHVTFVSKNVHQPISELDLRNIFERFGNVVDVAIKKSVFNKELGIQSGYGFIHFSLTDEGIQSALAAVDEVNHTVINFISFECTVTHGLKTYLFSLRSRGGGGGGVGGAMGSGGGAPQVGAFNTYNSNSNGNAGGGGGKMMRDVDRLPSAYYAAPPQPPMGAQNFGAPLPLVMPPPHVAQYSQQQPYPATQYPNRGGGGSYSPPPNRNMQAHDFMRETQQLPQHAYYPSSSMSSMTNEGGVPSSFNQTSSPNSASTSTYSILNNNVPYTSSVLTTSSNSTYDMNNITVVEERRPVVDFDDIIESSFEKPTKMSSVTQKKLVLETEGLLSPNQDN